MSTGSIATLWPACIALLCAGALGWVAIGGSAAGQVPQSASSSPARSPSSSTAASGSGSADAQAARALALLDAARAATGGGKWAGVHAIRYRATVSSGKRQGTAETVEDTRTGRFVDRYLLGEVQGGQGFDGTAAWTADVRGSAVSDGAAEGAAANVNEVYRRSLAYWFRARHPARFRDLGSEARDGRTYERLSIEPEGGRPFEMWIDLDSHRIARLLDTDSGVERAIEFSDFRAVQGLTMPFTVRTSVGDPRLDTLVQFTSIEIDPELPADAFARPPARGAAPESMPAR